MNIQHSFDFGERVDYRELCYPGWKPSPGKFAQVDGLTAQLDGRADGNRRYAYGELVRLDELLPDGRWRAHALHGGSFLLEDHEVWPTRLLHYLVVHAGYDIFIDLRSRKIVARFPPLE